MSRERERHSTLKSEAPCKVGVVNDPLVTTETRSSSVESCRSCGSTSLHQVVDLGLTPVANALVDPDQGDRADPVYPLTVVFCRDCALVQLGHILPASAIFDADYPYYSSFSDELCRHAAEHVAQLVDNRRLDSRSFVVEVASNDGYLLRNFTPSGIRCLGIDPSVRAGGGS